MKGSEEMFPPQRFLVLVALNDLGDIVDIVARRIRIVVKRMQLLVFGNLSNEFLQTHFLVGLSLFVYSPLFLSLLLTLLSCLEELLFLFTLLLDVKLHFGDFGLDKVELFMQFKVILILLLLNSLLFRNIGTDLVFVKFPSSFSAIFSLLIFWRRVFSFFLMVSSGIFFLIFDVPNFPIIVISLPIFSSPISVHIW
jgi:hypothetical protein